jgi:hypothetical protein
MILINLKNGPKFIIFMAPKCGCGTLWTLLTKHLPYCKMDINNYKGQYGCIEFYDKSRHYRDFFDHIGPSEGLKLLEKKINLSNFKKIGFVRKHIDRLLSLYKFDIVDNNFYEKYDPEYNTNSYKPTFNEYLTNIKDRKFYNNTLYNLDLYYLDNKNKLLVDKLYDFHDFNNEIIRLFSELKINLNINEIPRIHETEKREIEYDEKLLEKSIVYEMYITKNM